MNRGGCVNLTVAREILRQLAKHGLLARSTLERKARLSSHSIFNRHLAILCEWQLAMKISPAKRAPYSITAKGRSFLEALV